MQPRPFNHVVMSDFLLSTSQLVEESDESEVSFDSSSEEEEDNETHDQLIESVSALGKKRKLELRDEPSTVVSEFNFRRGNVRVDTDELLSGLTNKKGLKQLKQKLKKIKENTTHLIKPLAPVQKDKIHREVAYQKSSKQVSDWDAIVKFNRRAEHLKFPLQDDVPTLPSLTTKVESFKAVTPLEVAVQNMLSQSDSVIPDDEELSKAEKNALLKLSIQEAKERRAELSKMRSLLSAYEQKQKRINRIKSKRFHKIMRKRKEKLEAKRAVENETNLLEKADKLRAKERATLKHSRMSKWAKEQLTRNHKDPSTRLALTEQAQLKSEIKQKAFHESDSDVESTTSETNDCTDNDPVYLTDPSNPWLTKAAETRTSSADVAGSLEDTSQTKTSFKNIDPTDFFTIEKLNDELMIGSDKNLAAVQEAFADDDVIDEFIKEKQNEIDSSKEKEIDLALPGWGKWAGEGVEEKPNKVKPVQSRKQEHKVPRRDENLKYVIINHGKDKKASQHFVSKLPHPYTNPAHFARQMATPIGRHWNTETNYNELIKPRIETKIGYNIEPMKRTDDVERFMKRAKQDKATDRKKRRKHQPSVNIE